MKSKIAFSVALAIALAATINVSVAAPSFAAGVKAGQVCKKINRTSVVEFAPYRTKTFKCQKKSRRLVWVLKATTPVLGSSGNPVPVGVKIKVGTFTYKFDSYEVDRSDLICAENGYNTGCTYDYDYGRSVDPAATGRWMRFAFTVTNAGADAEPYVGNIGAVVGGHMQWAQNSSPVAPDALDDRIILQGQSDRGYLYAYFDKSISPEKVIIRTSSWSAPDIFFKLF